MNKTNGETFISYDLKHTRQQYGISRKALGDKLNISKYWMIKYESMKMIPEDVYLKLKSEIPQWFIE